MEEFLFVQNIENQSAGESENENESESLCLFYGNSY